MNSMTHRGLTARIEFDDRDDIFVGRVVGVRDIIGFHGETVAELRNACAEAIDDYLADCEMQGIKPPRPASGKMLLRMPPELHAEAIRAAELAGKSLNQWAADTLRNELHEV